MGDIKRQKKNYTRLAPNMLSDIKMTLQKLINMLKNIFVLKT